MAAPILWARGKIAFFLQETHVHKIPRFRGGVILCFGGGGGSADFIFMGARIFLILRSSGATFERSPPKTPANFSELPPCDLPAVLLCLILLLIPKAIDVQGEPPAFHPLLQFLE